MGLTKAQEAALAQAEKIIREAYPSDDVRVSIDIHRIIEEYNLTEKSIFPSTINKIYSVLMEKEFYGVAAEVAKKYGL